MRPRILKQRLMQTAREDRLLIVSEGLTHLAEHVSKLCESVASLNASGQVRGATILRGLAQEEAAKMLILLDLARLDDSSDEAVAAHLGKFYHHLARGIYARMTDYRIASYNELLEAVDHLRAELYLDGPMDVDWIFRNEIEAEREDSLYVDLVDTDEGPQWFTPARLDELSNTLPGAATTLVLAMERLGFFSKEGLVIVADVWRPYAPQIQDQWADLVDLIQETIRRLVLASIFRDLEAGVAAGRQGLIRA